MSKCPCGSQLEYDECCGSLQSQKAQAKTAEAVMRARYSAFVTGELDYLAVSNLDNADFELAEAKSWAKESKWMGLEVVKTEKGQAEHQAGTVEFKAYYQDKEEQARVHHEIAEFKKVDGQWKYVKGTMVGFEPVKRTSPKIGRNDPCSCGSGKKYKKCCGA
jgi:SEC-C motif-containing protein